MSVGEGPHNEAKRRGLAGFRKVGKGFSQQAQNPGLWFVSSFEILAYIEALRQSKTKRAMGLGLRQDVILFRAADQSCSLEPRLCTQPSLASEERK